MENLRNSFWEEFMSDVTLLIVDWKLDSSNDEWDHQLMAWSVPNDIFMFPSSVLRSIRTKTVGKLKFRRTLYLLWCKTLGHHWNIIFLHSHCPEWHNVWISPMTDHTPWLGSSTPRILSKCALYDGVLVKTWDHRSNKLITGLESRSVTMKS